MNIIQVLVIFWREGQKEVWKESNAANLFRLIISSAGGWTVSRSTEQITKKTKLLCPRFYKLIPSSVWWYPMWQYSLRILVISSSIILHRYLQVEQQFGVELAEMLHRGNASNIHRRLPKLCSVNPPRIKVRRHWRPSMSLHPTIPIMHLFIKPCSLPATLNPSLTL